MRRLLALAAACSTVLAGSVDDAAATNECRGLNPCVPVAGPWVVVPVSRGVPRPQAQYQLSCPRGHVVGGLDAELTDRAIDVAFLGRTGSPVGPGTTTARTVVFVATYVGSTSRVQSFRPRIGCLPASGGGPRVPTAASAIVPPGEPTVRRAKTVRVRGGTSRQITQRCRRDERLVGASHARAFFTRTPPDAALVAGLRARLGVRAGRVVVRASASEALGAVRAVVQVSSICAGGR